MMRCVREGWAAVVFGRSAGSRLHRSRSLWSAPGKSGGEENGDVGLRNDDDRTSPASGSEGQQPGVLCDGRGPSTQGGLSGVSNETVIQPEGGGLVLEVAVLGVPNVGKSTLTNALIGRKVSIESPRVQTTRERVLGVATTDRTQIMYFDTPGLISHAEGRRHGLARPLLTDAKNAVASADLVLGIVDGRYDTLPPIIAAIEAAVDVHGRRVPSVCVINKVDMLGRRDLARVLGDVAGVSRSAPEYQFDSVFQVSALRGDGVADLREYLQQQARPGMWQYAKGQATDQDLIKCVEERVREQLLRHLRLEVPYASFQRNLQIVETADEIEVVQAVVVKSKSQRNMVIGKGGVVIRAIAETAERELSEFCGKPVRLRLSVIVANEKQRRVRQM